MIAGRSLKSVMVSLKALIFACSAAEREGPGMTLIVNEFVSPRRKMISVAKRVQRFSLRGNGISVRASSTYILATLVVGRSAEYGGSLTEDFPAD